MNQHDREFRKILRMANRLFTMNYDAPRAAPVVVDNSVRVADEESLYEEVKSALIALGIAPHVAVNRLNSEQKLVAEAMKLEII